MIKGVGIVVKDVTTQRTAEEEAKRLQQHLEAAQRVGKVGSWEYHIQDDIIWGSEEGSRIYGLTHIDGDYPIDLIESCIPEREMVHQALLDLIAEEKPYNLEFAINPIGSTEQKIVRSVAELVKDEEGKPLLVTGVVQDVTEQRKTQRQIEQAEARFRRALMNAPLPTIIHAEDGEIILINSVWHELSGYSIEEIPTVPDWTEKVYGERKEIVKEGIDRLFDLNHRVSEGEFQIKAKNGKILYWDFYTTPLGVLSDGRRIVLSMATDVTERKEAEVALATSNALLEQRVQERTQELEAANSELASFVYSVSHDLRAPIRAIDGFSYLILNNEENTLSEKSVDHFNRIRQNTKMLSDIIDDLLNFSRVDREKLNESVIHLGDLVQQVVNELNPDLTQHTIEFRFKDLDIHCLGDEGLLKIVFNNLLSNAIKFSRNRKPARIEVGAEVKDQSCEIYVKDNGVGFNMAYVDKIFTVFERLHRADEFEGTGVGLAIVKNIVEKHGGHIWVDAVINEGATFIFTLNVNQ